MTRDISDQKIDRYDRYFGIEIETCWGEDTPEFDYKVEYAKHRALLLSVLSKRMDIAKTARGYKVSDYWEGTTENSYWHIKHDGTCGISKSFNGWEIASFKAKVKDFTEVAWALNEWQKLDIQVNTNCGLHVHVDVSDFSEHDIGVLMARWVRVEKEFLQLVPVHRREEEYCKPITEIKKISKTKSYSANEFWKKVKPTNLGTFRNLQKRVTLNTVNYLRSKNPYGDDTKCTVEFRFPESTLDWITVLNWVSIFLIFVEKSKGKKMPKKLQPIDSEKKFFAYIGVKDEKLKEWMRIRKFMFSGGKNAKLVL